jgi:hypothetical protein
LINEAALCVQAVAVETKPIVSSYDVKMAAYPKGASDGPGFGGILDPSTPAFKALPILPRSTNALLEIHTGAAFPISQDCLPSSKEVLTCGQRVRGVSLEEQSRCCIIV